MEETEYREFGDDNRIRVGAQGSVWSKRKSGEWKPLSMSLRNGKPTVAIIIGKKYERRHVAALVLEAFVGPCPSGKKPIHKNGRKTDCSLANLVWGERQRQCIFDEEVEADLEMLGESGISEILRYFWGAGVPKKSIAESMETEYRTIQYVIDKHSTKERLAICGFDCDELESVLRRLEPTANPPERILHA